MTTNTAGTVYLVGAGPGDPGLITVRGRELLTRADAIVHDRLIPHELLDLARPGARIIDVGKRPGSREHTQENINAILVAGARQHRTVVRLKGGDPFVFGRGWEEWSACQEAGIACVVVPGVTSATSAAAAIGVPVTHRGIARSFAVVTPQASGGCPAGLDYPALAAMDTLVIMMGRSRLDEVTRGLIGAGLNADTPAACIERGTMADQRSVIATVATIARRADEAAIHAPAITIIGEVANLADKGALPLSEPACTTPASIREARARRILITRSRESIEPLADLVRRNGAVPVTCPLIRVDYPPPDESRGDDVLMALRQFEWVVFSSVHGVRGFFHHLAERGLDARALGSSRIAAIGPITAAALARRGISPDLVPTPYSTARLLRGLMSPAGDETGRILHPCGRSAHSPMRDALRALGDRVEETAVYQTVKLTPDASSRREIEAGVDAVLLASPTAARRFAQLALDVGQAAIVAIGPSTAKAARAAGLVVHAVARRHSNEGMVEALANVPPFARHESVA